LQQAHLGAAAILRCAAPRLLAPAQAAPTFAGYKEKIAGLWEQYQAKRAKEQELLAKSERILQSLVRSSGGGAAAGRAGWGGFHAAALGG
jgi:hypothetical protein